MTLPTKLKQDTIAEAIVDFRFESSAAPEVVVGKLLDRFGGLGKAERQFTADLPAAMRNSDPTMRVAPWYEIRASGNRVLRVGPYAATWHQVGTYSGWHNGFRSEIETLAKALVELVPSIVFSRLGLRYINAFVPARHFITGIHDLNLRIQIDGEQIVGPILFATAFEDGREHLAMVKIVSPTYAAGAPPETVALVDVDVFWEKPASEPSAKWVMAWTDRAHEFEKQCFFRLIPRGILDRLIEK